MHFGGCMGGGGAGGGGLEGEEKSWRDLMVGFNENMTGNFSDQ